MNVPGPWWAEPWWSGPVRWLAGRMADRERMVLLIGVTVRLAGAVMLGYAVPLVWARLPAPGLAALLAVSLVATGVGMVAWWLAGHRVGAAWLAVEVPVGMLALYANALLDATSGTIGWTDFAYPYTVLVGFALGLPDRGGYRLLLAGLPWGAAYVAAAVLVDHAPLVPSLLALPAYQIGPVLGLACARLLRRYADDLAAARVAAVETADALATATERARHARALHDRVLQTVETLARGGTIADPALRSRAAEQAGWLRRFVETGRSDQDENLAAALAGAVRVAAGTGAPVQLNDAGLRDGGPDVTPARREVLTRAVHRVVADLAPAAGVVVRAAPDGAGVLVTVLATGPAPAPDPDGMAALAAQLATVGGRLTVEPDPYVEIWVPT